MMKRSILMTIAALFGTVQAWGATVDVSTWANLKSNLEAGNSVKLTANIQQDASIATLTGMQNVTLDLNGKTITQYGTSSGSLYIINCSSGSAKVTIKDSIGTGAIVGNATYKTIGGSGGGGFKFDGSSSLTLESGTLKNFRLESASSTILNGGCIYIGSSASFTMNGGTIKDCSCSANGGAVYNAGTFTMNGGVLTGNKANDSSTSASAIIYNNGGTATVNGGVSDNSHIGDFKASGKECKLVGTKYVVGKSVAKDSNNKLTAGTYTFNPLNAEYVSAGVTLADGKDVRSVAGSPVALHYVMDSDKSILAFDAQSGTGAESARTITVGDKTLGGTSTTKPTRSGYLFCGYFTGTDGTGTQVFDSNGAVIGMWAPPATGITLYASWIQVQPFESTPGPCGTFSSGNYYMAPNATYDAASCRSGLYVEANATTYLYIPAGTTFTVNGGAGSGASPGGAGINLPSSSTLVVFGGGTLKAIGGNAGNGSDGTAGGSGELSISGDWQRGGKGGTGGAGGGGAGAGIGGSGGAGGAAKEGPDGPYTKPCQVNNSCKDGNNGYTGNAGSNGGAAGVLYALGSVKITANGGSAGSTGGTGGGRGVWASSSGSSWANKYSSAPGGGGGGGGSGGSGWAIGGGGYGGGSGGSGGTGGTTGRVSDSTYASPGGQAGFGGSGYYNGKQGTPTYTDYFTKCGSGENKTIYSGSGGSGGSNGTTPGNSTVYKRSTATVSGGNQTSATTHSGLLRTLTLVDCGATSAGTTSQSADFQNWGSNFSWTGADITVPTRTGCTFAGYYTDQFGRGTQHIGADGKWTTGYSMFAARKLYAKWTAALTVAKEGEGAVTGSGSVVAGSEVTIAAQPAAGSRFLGWSDGVTDSVRTVEVASNVTYTARFVSGTPAGDNTWAYVTNGVCTVYGTGVTSNEKPLDAQWASIKDVRIADGVTGLGENFFYKFYNLTNVTIAASCTSLGNGALFRCLSLEQVTFEGDTLPTLGENALPIRAAIKMNGSTPVVMMVPKVIVGGKEPTLKGSNDLSNWENVTAGNEGDYHFFKYVIQ